jgi:hypothetical protein
MQKIDTPDPVRLVINAAEWLIGARLETRMVRSAGAPAAPDAQAADCRLRSSSK